jgi:cation transporter-like permease
MDTATTATTTTMAPTTFACPLVSALNIINNYAEPALSVVGILANTWCVVLFSLILRHERQNGHMFKYLLLKAVHDVIQFLAQVFVPLYYCTSCGTYGTYSEQVWAVWFYWYVECVNELCSALFEVAATWDCLITLTMKFQCCQNNVVFYVTSAVFTIYPCLYYIFLLYEFQIVKVTIVDQIVDVSNSSGVFLKNVTSSYYTYEYTDFVNTQTYFVFRFMNGMVRDVILLVLLLVLNGLILSTMKRSLERKRRMTLTTLNPTVTGGNLVQSVGRKRSVATSAATRNQAVNDAERNVTIMIVASGVNYFVGHVVMFVKNCVFTKPSVVTSCLQGIGVFVFYASYASPFFIYFAFNKLFRSYAFGKRNVNTGIANRSIAASRTNPRKF